MRGEKGLSPLRVPCCCDHIYIYIHTVHACTHTFFYIYVYIRVYIYILCMYIYIQYIIAYNMIRHDEYGLA